MIYYLHILFIHVSLCTVTLYKSLLGADQVVTRTLLSSHQPQTSQILQHMHRLLFILNLLYVIMFSSGSVKDAYVFL